MKKIEIFNNLFRKVDLYRKYESLTWAQLYSTEAQLLINWFDFDEDDVNKNKKIMQSYQEKLKIKSIIWFIPDFDNPFWGGIHTILRFAAYFSEKENIQNTFVIIGSADAKAVKEKINRAFPSLNSASVLILNSEEELSKIPPADISICTLWTTAYHSLKFNGVKRKFYFIQDYEPLFYPAGSISALVEETYQFGYYGIANTPSLKNIYVNYYGGISESFIPQIDLNTFSHSNLRKENDQYLLFFYARPGHPRNGFELGIAALKKIKYLMKDKIRIVTAGSTWDPIDYHLEGIVENLGLLSYGDTGKLYQSCDIGLVMMFTRHPSYLPFELMASGCLVVTNHNPSTTWFLKDNENCLLTAASVSSICQIVQKGLDNTTLRKKITDTAKEDIELNFCNWDKEMGKIFNYMCNPLE